MTTMRSPNPVYDDRLPTEAVISLFRPCRGSVSHPGHESATITVRASPSAAPPYPANESAVVSPGAIPPIGL